MNEQKQKILVLGGGYFGLHSSLFAKEEKI